MKLLRCTLLLSEPLWSSRNTNGYQAVFIYQKNLSHSSIIFVTISFNVGTTSFSNQGFFFNQAIFKGEG